MNDDQVILPNEDLPAEDQLQEGQAKGEGMVTVPDDLPHAHLVLESDEEQSFEIRGDAVIGRFDETVGPVDIDLNPVDTGRHISRKHAEIRSADSRWFLKDLGSANGTFVMGAEDFERIDDEVELADGDTVSFGNLRFVFHVTHKPTEAEALEPESA